MTYEERMDFYFTILVLAFVFAVGVFCGVIAS